MDEATRGQIRGSSLLLAGRFVALGLNFLSQVLIARYLSTTDYGAWAYALAAVALLQVAATLGLHRSVARLVPIYHERQETGALLGALVAVAAGLALTACLLVLGFHLLSEPIARLMAEDSRALPLLAILIFLVPVEAADTVLIGLFASFSRPRDIFFRKHVLAPGLKLAVVGLLLANGSGVAFLAWGYLAASATGVLVYGVVLLRHLRRQGLFEASVRRDLRLPLRELFTYSFPLLTSDLLIVFIHTSSALLLGYYRELEQVAVFQVVVPLAMLNLLVRRTFALLYLPTAARLFARDDGPGLAELYRRTTLWMATISFPIFASTFALSAPLTRMLYGERYESSALILSVLSLGYYFSVALGFNALTLKVLGRLRFVLLVELLAAVFHLLANAWLIPAHGATGAAWASCLTFLGLGLLQQAGLSRIAGIRLLDRRYASFYLSISAATLLLLPVPLSGYERPWLLAVPAAAASALVLLLNRKSLQVAETFPELHRVPWMRAIFT